MMSLEEYYATPPQEIFDDIKQNAILIWKGYNDDFGYATQKIKRVEQMDNFSDNAWCIVSMFDPNNQSKLISMVKPKTAAVIVKVINF